jgi:DNA primase
MMDPQTGRVVGIRLRTPGGAKFAVKGGAEGLFIPDRPPGPGPLLIAEGPTDVAALLDLGFDDVAGRPSCTGGVRHLVALVRSRRARDVVIVADADEAGRRGADNLVSVLLRYARAVRVIVPPGGAKDVRAFLRAEGTRADLDAEIDAALVRRLQVASGRTVQ